MGGHYDANPYGPLTGPDAPHVARYMIARGFVNPGEFVLDAGCGTGYGSRLIADVAKVLAVDAETTYSQKWAHENVQFAQLDLGKAELPDVDVTICIEVAEHINGLEHFVEQVQKHTNRLILICAPLGGTSHAYTEEEQATPAGENNDFNNIAHLEATFATNGWRAWSAFQFGYSGIVTLLRE